MLDLRSRWTFKACKASWTCSHIRGSLCSGPPSAMAQSCPGACRRSMTCRAAGAMCRSREATGCGGGTTRRCSGTPPTRISWKSVLFPPRELIWAGSTTPDGFTVDAAEGRADRDLGDPPYAILGIRSCDLHALAIHDRVLRDRAYPDARYAARRKDAFLVTVICSDPSGTCFCVSMGTGPRAESGYDLALTELLDGEHTFLARAGSDRGAGVLDQLQTMPAAERQVEAAEQVVEHSIRHMGRTMDTTDIRTLLYDNAEHPRWDDVGQPLSVVRQLHDGVPDLLLHLGGRPHLPVGRATPSAGVSGTRASPPTSPMCTVAASAAAGRPATGSG